MELHIASDVAYAVWHYYCITGDEQFLLTYGAEMLFETARFWMSRLAYKKKHKIYEIRHIIGPDEFHIDVDNNAYTNAMTRWNLFIAYSAYTKMKEKFPKYLTHLRGKIKLKQLKE